MYLFNKFYWVIFIDVLYMLVLWFFKIDFSKVFSVKGLDYI